jgi:putative ABC transport system permease protein
MAFKGVTVNLARSLLTMLGIIIGVGSVVLMSSIGNSMQGVILSQISSLGADSMVIFPGQDEGGPGIRSAGFDSLTFDDIDALRNLSTIDKVAPVIFLPGKATYGREEGSPQTLGVTEEFFTNQKIYVERGRFIDNSDVNGSKNVAVLAPDAVENLFGNEDPLGKSVKVGAERFTVIGISKALGSQFFQNADDRIYVPYSVAKEATHQSYASYITMVSTGDSELAVNDVKSLLRTRHSIDNPKEDPKKDDFVVHTSAEANQILSGVSLGLTMFITTIAAISLIVGGIGIMNIMLVTVTERTREIGLRKALGATARNILLQFLFESIFLTVIGGMIGVIGGIILAFLIALIVKGLLATYVFSVSIPSIIVAFLMAALTGIVFGLSPARKAAALSPMESLRYE